MGANDVIEGFFDPEAEIATTLRIETACPARDDAFHQRVLDAADACGDLVPRDAAERLDLFANGAADARHAEVDAVAELFTREFRGMDEEADGRARAGVPVPHAFVHRQQRLLAGQGLADDAR